MLCAVLAEKTIQAVQEKLDIALVHAEAIEFRLDYLESYSLEEVAALKKGCPLPMIFTMRRADQGGRFKGTEKERLEAILSLANLGPAYFDLETGTAVDFIHLFRDKYPSIKLIYSTHDFEKTPVDLERLVEDMQSIPADIYKVAVQANSIGDLIRSAQTLRKGNKNLALMNMGEWGHVLRILSPILGNALTYASVDQQSGSAPGQVALNELIDLYRYKELSFQTEVFALIGDPVDKSIGHLMHNPWMKETSRDSIYIKIKVRTHELEEFISHLSDFSIKGLSVTMPLKESVIPFLNELTVSAQKIGAVNTILYQEGKLIGHNTDGVGALNAIERHIPVKGKRLVILGAGGAARAIAYEAILRGAKVTILNRNPLNAQIVADLFGCSCGPLSALNQIDYQILINATPLSMPVLSIKPEIHAFDINTIPKQTEFIKEALNVCCHAIYGYEMFIEQACGQVQIWNEGNLINLTKIQEILEKNVRFVL